jgi:tartrate dehydratase alpha subunit/fumarate hydratase class I-like protein
MGPGGRIVPSRSTLGGCSGLLTEYQRCTTSPTTCAPRTCAAAPDHRRPERRHNDRFVALDLLKNANIAAGGVLPMCQDTGTAIVMGKRGQHVLTAGRDEEAISAGVYDAYTRLNLRYSSWRR